MLCRDAAADQKLLEQLRHFPRVFHCWLLYITQIDPNRLLQVLTELGRHDDIAHLLIVNAFEQTTLEARRDALKKTAQVIGKTVDAGRKDMAFFYEVGVVMQISCRL